MKRKKRQINNITLIYLSAGIVLAGIMTLFAVSSFFKINIIRVEGMKLYTAQVIAEAADVSKGDNLMFLNRSKTEGNILSKLPYINNAEIKREYPDTLVIEVTESKASAYIRYSGNIAVIDTTGRVLATNAGGAHDLMNIGDITLSALTEIRGVPIAEAEPGKRITFAQGSEPSFSAMLSILEAMEQENMLGDVDYLDVANITNISFSYMDMYRIVIGGLQSFRQKLAGLPAHVIYIQESFPNTRGIYYMNDPSGRYKFTPDE